MAKDGLTREEKKQRRREAHVPAPRDYTVQVTKGVFHPVSAKFGIDELILKTKLGDKNIVCTFKYGEVKVEKRVYYQYGWNLRQARDEKGKPVLLKVPFPGTTIQMTINGKTYSDQAVCKPPDVFSRERGKRLALAHLLKQKEVHSLIKATEFETLVRLLLTKPPKPSQIRRVLKMTAQKEPAPAPAPVATPPATGAAAKKTPKKAAK